MASRDVVMPSQRSPLVDDDGRINPTWYRFLVDLHERTGGSATDKVDDASTAAATAASPVQLAGASLSDSSIEPTDASVGYQLTAGGKEQKYEGSGASYTSIGDWLLSGAVADYKARLTVVSGTTPAGSPVGSWESFPVAWTLTDSSPIGQNIQNVCTVEIQNVTTGSSLISASVTMNVIEELAV